jgi:hypothetical protein
MTGKSEANTEGLILYGNWADGAKWHEMEYREAVGKGGPTRGQI